MQLRCTSLLVLAVVSLMMHGCKFVQSKSSDTLENIREQTESYQTYDQCEDVSVLESAKQAFYNIPDHAKVSENAKNYMTKDLYDALVAAWDVPCWCDGEIGEEEFLSYFVTGNGGSTVGDVVYVETFSVEDGRHYLQLKYTELWDGKPDDMLKTISLQMVNEGGCWLLDDFGNATKEKCKRYIRKEVEDFISGKTIQYMRENQSGEWYSEEHISRVEQAFKEYINLYDGDLAQFIVP